MPETVDAQVDQRSAWHHRSMLAADAAQQARDEAMLYGSDARRAYQRRVDTVSQSEAQALRSLGTSPMAELVSQLRAAVSQPPVSPTP